MAGERPPGRLQAAGWGAGRWVFLGVILAAVLLVVFHSRTGAAVLALVGLGLALFYTAWRIHVAPPGNANEVARTPALSLPLAGAVGLGTLLAIHIDPLGATRTLGTLTLVGFAFAFWLAVLDYFLFQSFFVSTPRALSFVGLRQLPVLTIVLVAWIATGMVKSPDTLHEARLTPRLAVSSVNGGETIFRAPTLREVFDEWVQAQPELDPSQRAGPPATAPMFLVAAHGGGIRAAYWTALALDCLVGVSSEAFNPASLTSGGTEARAEALAATCEEERRNASDQQAAARRILLVSGVSGGAVGLYAYARELIAARSLEEGWVDERLGGDFASAPVGWGLFHDVTNRWLGLHSERGGACAWSLFTCMTADRATLQEQAFDDGWPPGAFEPLLRLSWDLRESTDARARAVARTVPLLLTNTTVTGGRARGVVTVANLGAWPSLDSHDPDRGNFDAYPLAGTVEVVEAACATKDLRLSTAAMLGARFPYVSPAGHVTGHCRRSQGEDLGADATSPCATVKTSICEMRLVDGGYADNSGLFTIDALWPSLRQLVVEFNRTSTHKIAPVIVELDNHYRARIEEELAAGGARAESLVPLMTAFGARNSIETYARALAYRLRPPGCTVTISPGLHPGLSAPLGWELSEGARQDLREGLVRPRPTDFGENRYRAALDLRRLQSWLAGPTQATPSPSGLPVCIPTESQSP
jgi:hypothetical protein